MKVKKVRGKDLQLRWERINVKYELALSGSVILSIVMTLIWPKSVNFSTAGIKYFAVIKMSIKSRLRIPKKKEFVVFKFFLPFFLVYEIRT